MNDELRVTSDESPRPWRMVVEETAPVKGMKPATYIHDANDKPIWFGNRSPRTDADAALIVRAVNGRADLLKAREMLQAECRGLAAEADRLAEFVRKLCDMVADHPIWRPSEAEQWLINEARKAIGEGGAE